MQFPQERSAQLHFAVARRSVLYRDLPTSVIADFPRHRKSDLIIESAAILAPPSAIAVANDVARLVAFGRWGGGPAPCGPQTPQLAITVPVYRRPNPAFSQHSDRWARAAPRQGPNLLWTAWIS